MFTWFLPIHSFAWYFLSTLSKSIVLLLINCILNSFLVTSLPLPLHYANANRAHIFLQPTQIITYPCIYFTEKDLKPIVRIINQINSWCFLDFLGLHVKGLVLHCFRFVVISSYVNEVSWISKFQFNSHLVVFLWTVKKCNNVKKWSG